MDTDEKPFLCLNMSGIKDFGSPFNATSLAARSSIANL
jgi:hypothetical protein